MTQRGEQTRRRLLDATRKLVSEVGYPKVTTRAIVTTAGVAEGTLYRHFPDKTALFFATVMERHAAVEEWTAELPARAGTASVEENLSACLLRLAEVREDIMPLELAILTDPELAQSRQELVQGAAVQMAGPPAQLAAYLIAEQQLGRVRSDLEAGELAVVLLALLFGLAIQPAHPGGRTLDTLLRSGVRSFVEGIRPEPDQPGRRAAGRAAGRP